MCELAVPKRRRVLAWRGLLHMRMCVWVLWLELRVDGGAIELCELALPARRHLHGYWLGHILVRLRIGLEWSDMRYKCGCVRFVAVQEWRRVRGHGGRLQLLVSGRLDGRDV